MFSLSNAITTLAHYEQQTPQPRSLLVTFATDLQAGIKDARGPPIHLRALDICRIAAFNLVAAESTSSQATPQNLRAKIRHLAHAADRGFSPPDADDLHTYSAAELLEMIMPPADTMCRNVGNHRMLTNYITIFETSKVRSLMCGHTIRLRRLPESLLVWLNSSRPESCCLQIFAFGDLLAFLLLASGELN